MFDPPMQCAPTLELHFLDEPLEFCATQCSELLISYFNYRVHGVMLTFVVLFNSHMRVTGTKEIKDMVMAGRCFQMVIHMRERTSVASVMEAVSTGKKTF